MTEEQEREEVFEKELELQNRIRNLLWTVSGDYTLDMKPDVSLFLRSKAIALYDGVKQGAFARFYDKNLMGMYLVKKIYLGAEEGSLTTLAQLCIEEAIGEKICDERPGIVSLQKQACSDILDQEFEVLPAYGDVLGRLRIAVLRDKLADGSYKVEAALKKVRDKVYEAGNTEDTKSLIALIDSLYNEIIDKDFEKRYGNLERVMAVSLEELTEFGWEDFLTEEMYEEALEAYVEQLTERMTDLEDSSVTKEMEEKRKVRQKITVLPPQEGFSE